MRFAPIIRVSTEKQKKKKDSLLAQIAQIKGYVKTLNGEIPDHCWKYVGQESATPDHEHRMIKQLLEDSGKNLFDAVIVVEATRWSRDNRFNEEGLDILRDNRIKFYVGPMEHNLFDPVMRHNISSQVHMGQYLVDISAYKSITTRIEKAKRGEPATRLPYGRTFNKETLEWGVDAKKKLMINDIANRFLAGEDLSKLGQIYGMSRNYIRYILTERCGRTWTQSFKNKKFDIAESFETKVPALLEPEIIEAIKEKVQLNKTIFRGPLQKSEKGRTYQKYLFSKMILCGHCQTALFGEMMNKRTRHYRHRRATEYKGQITKVGCIHFKYVQADLIEEPIMKHIYEMFGDPSKIEKAIADAIPDLSETEELQKALIAQNNTLKGIDRKYDTYLDSLEETENKTSRSKIIKRMDDLEERHEAAQNEIKRIESKLKIIPNREEIKTKTNLIKRQIKGYFKFPGDKYYEGMSFEDKRSLLQYVFKGTDSDGARLGIYISKDSKGWLYEIKGIIISEIGRLVDDPGNLDEQKTTIVNRP